MDETPTESEKDELKKCIQKSHPSAEPDMECEESEEDTLCVKTRLMKILRYCWNLIKLFLAIWMLVDMVTDGLQAPKYYFNSPYWNSNHKCNSMTCNHTDSADAPLKLHGAYFPCCLAIWLISPLLYMIWFIFNFKSKYSEELEFELAYLRRNYCYPIVILPIVSILIIYVKLPFDVIRHALADLGWIPKKWASFGRTKYLEFAQVDAATNNTFTKFFEQFGEAVPQLALALTYYINNQNYINQTEFKVFGGVPTTLLAIILSAGSVLIGFVTGMIAGRKVFAARMVSGFLPLHQAAKFGDNQRVKDLIRAGVDLDFQNKYGRTAIHLASRDGQLNVVNTLIASGAHLDLQDENGTTALMLASMYGRLPIVNILVESGANMELTNENDETALQLALKHGRIPVANALLEAGAKSVS